MAGRYSKEERAATMKAAKDAERPLWLYGAGGKVLVAFPDTNELVEMWRMDWDRVEGMMLAAKRGAGRRKAKR